MANGIETEEREGGTESGDVGSEKLFSLHVVDLLALLFSLYEVHLKNKIYWGHPSSLVVFHLKRLCGTTR